jgi:uridine kinase
MRTGDVVFSSSTWQQPVPPQPTSARREVIAHVVELIDALGSSRLRIAIDGLTAAGKTSFGHEIARAIADLGRQVLRASLDDFKRPWREAHLYDRTSGEGYYRNAFDYDAVHRLLLEPAGPQGSGLVALCSIDPLTQIDHSAKVVPVSSDAVLIVDGVFAFRPELDDLWDLRIWLDVDPELSVRRGTQRDVELEGDADAAELLHRSRYLPSELLYLDEVDPLRAADIVIDNRDFDRPRVLDLSE